MAVSDFISKCCLKEAFTRAPNQYKEYLSEFWYTAKVLPDFKIWVSTPTGEVRGEIGITTFRNALRAQYLPHLSLYVPPPSITIVRPWFAMIGYNGEIGAKGTLKKSCFPPRWRLLMGQIIQCLGGKTSGLDQISNKDATILYCLANGVQVDYAKIIWEDLIHKLNKKTREKIVPYPRFISLLLEHMAPKYDNEELTINPTQMCLWTPKLPNTLLQLKRFPKAKSLELKKETKSSSAMDTSPSHPSPPTPVVGEMHKEAQQAAGGPSSLGDTSEDGAHLQLSSGADDISRKVKLEDLVDILKDTRSTFFTPDSPTDEPIIVLDVSEEEDNAKHDKDTEDTLVLPPSPKSAQIQELISQIHLLQSQKEVLEQAKVKVKAEAEPELSKLLASHEFASSLPTELKELPSKIIRLSGEIKELKQHVKDMELELHGDLKEIPSKLETFTSTISSLPSQVSELKNIHWELPAEFLDLPHLVSSVQEKLKTLDSLPSLLKKVTNTLNRFATLVQNASGATSTGVPSADKATASPAEGEKDADTNLKNELVDLLGIDIVTQEDETTEVIEKFKASDLQLAEWREVVQACLDRKEKGWKTIYELIKTRMEYLEQTQKELHIDFNKSLQEQDHLDELNDLANKKRKRTSDSTDHSRSSKRHKSSSLT
ncbi:hypothetical protein Tco_1508370 [Tanacetum coccineum]